MNVILCYQNKWLWKGTYDAYDANFINLILKE